MNRGAGSVETIVISMSVGSSFRKSRSASRSWRSASLCTGPLSIISWSLTGQLISSNLVGVQTEPSTCTVISSARRSFTGMPSPSTALKNTWIGCWAWSAGPAASAAAKATLPLIRQSKDVHLIVPPRRRDAGLRNQSAGESPFAAHDGDVLFAVHRVRNRAVVDGPAERGLPQNPAACRVERAELAVQIAPEDQVAGRGQHGAVPGGPTFIYVLDLAGLHADLGEPPELLRLAAFARDAAALGGHGRFPVGRRGGVRHVEAVVHPRHVQRALAGVICRGPVAAGVPEADDVMLAGSREDEVLVDRHAAGLAVDVADEEVGRIEGERVRPEELSR